MQAALSFQLSMKDLFEMANDILAILCDVGGVLIHKARRPELQQWEHRLGLEPMSLPLAIWLCPSAVRATLGKATVDDVWYEIQQKYNLSNTELETFKYDFAACDSVDPYLCNFCMMYGKYGRSRS